MRESSRLPGPRGARIELRFEGEVVACYAGETVATALLAVGIDTFGTTGQGGARSPLCNMGTCFECAVVVDGCQLTRACLTPAANGMDVRQTKGDGDV